MQHAPPPPAPVAIPALVGRSPLSRAGVPLFAPLAGLPMPGWLKAFELPARQHAYEGFAQTEALPPGMTLAVMRTQGLVGAYVLQAGRCIGDMLGEPLVLDFPGDAERALKQAGFKAKRRLIATRTHDFALDALQYERVRRGYTERYVFGLALARPNEGPEPRTFLCERAVIPEAVRGVMAGLQADIEDGVARYFQHEPATTDGLRIPGSAVTIGCVATTNSTNGRPLDEDLGGR